MWLAVMALPAISVHAASKPHLIFMLADDLGWYDTAITGDQSAEARHATRNLVQLANDGMRLSNHYVHWHCSPTRRSFLTGRSPLHHGEHLSGVTEDYIDLRWTWISEKLKSAGYATHWYGKGHTGFMSMRHMPANRGFDSSVLYLGGAGSYTNLQRWNGTVPLEAHTSRNPGEYSTDLFGSLAVTAVEGHDPSIPFFMYLPWQAVHSPYDLPPSCAEPTSKTCPNKIRAMIADVDAWTGKLVAALKAKGMYDHTLMVFTSDNGGTADTKGDVGGNNYPLRGGKHTQWQGGMRTTSFVSGGFLPSSLRGSTHNSSFHVTDWYPTFSHLAGVDGSDDAPVPPLPVDESRPDRDIYQGKRSWPPVDGINIWAELLGRKKTYDRTYLWLSAEAMIKDGRYKIVTAQQERKLTAFPPVTGWRRPDGSWVDGGKLDGPGCGLAFLDRAHFRPCLFDLQNDEREMKDLSRKMPELVAELWRELNRTALTAYLSRSPPEMRGHCNATCAGEKWAKIASSRRSVNGPICGVPGCDASLASIEWV